MALALEGPHLRPAAAAEQVLPDPAVTALHLPVERQEQTAVVLAALLLLPWLRQPLVALVDRAAHPQATSRVGHLFLAVQAEDTVAESQLPPRTNRADPVDSRARPSLMRRRLIL